MAQTCAVSLCHLLLQKTAPSLSQEKKQRQEKPMDFLVQRAAVDPATKWRRVFQLGSKSELLVTVKQPEGLEGPTRITLLTDTATPVVLHWGVTKPGRRQ